MDIVFASTSIHDELFQLGHQFLDLFLLFNTHGESEIDPRHQRRIIAAAIGVGCEKEGGVGSFLLEKDEERG